MNYNDAVKEHFFAPFGVASQAETNAECVSVQTGEQAVGDVVVVNICLNSEKVITHLTFKAMGNPYLIAVMSYLCLQYEGRAVGEFNKVDYQALVSHFDIPRTKVHSAMLAIDSIHKAVNEWEKTNA